MLRSPLILFAAPAGILAGGLAWIAAGGATASIDKLAPTRAQVASLTRANRAPREMVAADVTELGELPLLLLTTGPGAVALPVVGVDGLVRTRVRRAALVTIDGKPSQWLSVGDTVAGVTLREVESSHAVIETAYGLQDVPLGERSLGPPPPPPSAGSSAASALPGIPVITGPAAIPPGYRSPPPPASAPGPR